MGPRAVLLVVARKRNSCFCRNRTTVAQPTSSHLVQQGSTYSSYCTAHTLSMAD